jgi:glycosyltransferase involved in cell wall biosynthesis
MKVLILNYEYPPLGGGAGVVSKYHAEGLSSLGHKVTVITTWFPGEKESEEIGNLSIIKLKSKRRYSYRSTVGEWLSWIKITKRFLFTHLKQDSYDYCFSHFALPGGEVARYIQKKFNLSYAVISHGQDIPWFFPKQMFKYHIFTYFWIKTICKKADKLILLTDAMKKNADRFMGVMKYKNLIIPNGCETAFFFPDTSKKNSTFKIIFAGRLVEQKDPFTFLKAIKIIKDKGIHDFMVHLMGDGPLKAKMNEFVKINDIEQFVLFKGWVDKKDLLIEYQSAHLHVISSRAEAMSMAALESLSTGLYVLSTPVSGNTDLIIEHINGEFFGYGNSEQLAEKIIEYKEKKYGYNNSVSSGILTDFRNRYDWMNIIHTLALVLPKKQNQL